MLNHNFSGRVNRIVEAKHSIEIIRCRTVSEKNYWLNTVKNRVKLSREVEMLAHEAIILLEMILNV